MAVLHKKWYNSFSMKRLRQLNPESGACIGGAVALVALLGGGALPAPFHLSAPSRHPASERPQGIATCWLGGVGLGVNELDVGVAPEGRPTAEITPQAIRLTHDGHHMELRQLTLMDAGPNKARGWGTTNFTSLGALGIDVLVPQAERIDVSAEVGSGILPCGAFDFTGNPHAYGTSPDDFPQIRLR
jgi:hypothetical protein